MLLHTSLLVLLPAVVLAGPNTPSGWTCKPLTQVDVSHEDCIQTSSYANGVWTINTQKVGTDTNRFCVVTLTGPGVNVKDTDNFYVRATFGSSQTRGPIGGISFNMDEADNGNYVMMRMRIPSIGNVEIGRLVDGRKSYSTSQTTNTKNEAVVAGNPTLEILVKDDNEDVWINGNLEQEISDVQPYYVRPGGVGFAFQNVFGWQLSISNAEVCTAPCKDDAGNEYLLGATYKDGDQTCTCKESGFECACGDTTPCGGGLTRWVDQETCESKCIPPPAYCVSSGDPHYKSFDGKYFDFHGECTYQAASCGKFDVYFKNVDLLRRAPRFTKRVELVYGDSVFSIENNWQPKVDGQITHLPFIKEYNNGDRVELINNGQQEIRVYNKNGDMLVRLRATNYGNWINAEMWLHGSCADITEGICGNWNGNSGDDLIGGSPNALGEQYKQFDENCPAPPLPPDPCADIGNLHDEAEAICSALLKNPFTQCHGAIDVGDRNGGPLKNCMTDVCNCFLDNSCACSQFDVYATECQTQNIDLSNWRESVEFCPYKCPEPTVYKANGATPVPTCLDRNPEQTGTVRGCFCPEGQFQQDGECVAANACKCLYEGQFYNNGDVIKKDGLCPAQTCTCQDAGEMTCVDDPCPELNCAADELEGRNDDECCNSCIGNWVVAVNPDNQIKKGQSVKLTCRIMVDKVSKNAITWYRDGVEITKGISKNKKMLTINNADADDDATYTCEATKDGVTASDDFVVDVVMPAICEHEDGTEFEEGTFYNPQETEECTCDALGVHTCACVDDGEECEDPTPVAWFDDTCIKTCVPQPGHCSAAADPFYKTFDGSEFAFKGDCKYNFFGCGDVKMFADHEKEKASAKTKSLEVAFKTDLFKLEGNTVTLNGETITLPMHKTYKDGSEVRIEDLGTYAMTITQDGKDPLVYLQWDKVSSYSIDVHGSCKGSSTGMCGKWDDDDSNDLTGPDGEVLDSVEDFGTAWAVDDEADCPPPPPPDDICRDFGLMDQKPDFEKHIGDILKSKPFTKCKDAMDIEATIADAVQQICGCFGDLSCGCAPLNKFAGDCKAQAGIDTDAWQLNFPESKCAVECPDGTSFMAKGPKPAPSCEKPNGGKKAQAGCFCPEGEMLEDGKCVSLENCQCEYAGQLYGAGDKFEKGAECKTCKCVGGGVEECEDKACTVECGDDEIEVSNEGDCCPTCQANWVEAVNPNPAGPFGEPLELTCRVNGVDVKKGDIRWFKLQPLKDITNWKSYSVSDDGLTFTILKMDAKMVNNYKCVVTKDGKTSEGNFEVSLQTDQCEDAGKLFNVGDNFEKGCQTCTCTAGGVLECEDKECDVDCGDDELEITNEGDCCPTCLANWVEAVNPTPDTVNGQPVELTCRVNGVEVKKGAVKWFKLEPLKDITKWKMYDVSDDGLTLTIPKMEARMENGYKCVVTKNGKTAEGTFEVALPDEEIDLVEAVEDKVAFVEGGKVVLRCKKLEKKIKIQWTCNGNEMVHGEGNVKIRTKNGNSELEFKPAKLSDKGTCTCSAEGQGTTDSVDIQVGGVENEVTITPKVTELTCKQGDASRCVIEFDVTSTIGDPGANDVKFWKLKDGELDEKSSSSKEGNTFSRVFGQWKKPSRSGQYVVVVTVKGKTYQSEPVTLTVLPKD